VRVLDSAVKRGENMEIVILEISFSQGSRERDRTVRVVGGEGIKAVESSLFLKERAP